MKHITIVDRKQYSEEGWKLLVSVCREDDLIIEMNTFFKLLETMTTKERETIEWELRNVRLSIEEMKGMHTEEPQ